MLSLLPSLQSVILSLLVRLLRVTALSLVDAGVALDAQSLKVVPVEGQLLHLHERVRRLHRHLVMHVDGRGDDAFCQASLA